MDDEKHGEMSTKYGFSGRLRSEFPSQIVIDLTELCNLECSHCPRATFKKSSLYTGCNLDPVLNRKAVDETRAHGQGITQYIRYSAEGEPLLHPQIFDMLAYAHRNAGTVVTLTTNGTLLNEAMAESLVATGIDSVDISIDAFLPETYSRIRKNGDLEVTRRNVLKLLEITRQHNSKMKVVASFVEQPDNLGEAKDFESFWKGCGLDYVVIRRWHSAAGAVPNRAKTMRDLNTAICRRPCLYPWERIVLNPRGWLAFCPADWTFGASISDYRTTSIKQTWAGDFYGRLRKAHLDNNFLSFEFCGECPDWAAIRWPSEGRSYADMIREFNQVSSE